MSPRVSERFRGPSRQVGAWCALACSQFFLCEQLARLRWPAHYSMAANYISDLGEASLSSAHALMNSSFGLQAILIAAASLLLPRLFAPTLLGRLARGLLLFSALGLALVATNPADRNLSFHVAGAGLHFLCGALGMLLAGFSRILYGRALGSRLPPRAMREIRITLLFAGIAVAGDLLLAFGGTHAFLRQGTVERLAAYPLPLWLVYSGYRVLREPEPSRLAWHFA